MSATGLQTLFSGLSLVSILLLWWQIRDANRWNRLRAEQTFYSDKSRDLSVDLCKSIERLGIRFRMRKTPLTPDEAMLIVEDPEGSAFYNLVRYLNDMETMASAVLAQNTNEAIAYQTHSARLSYALSIYAPVIERIERDFAGTNVFMDMRALRKRWDDTGPALELESHRRRGHWWLLSARESSERGRLSLDSPRAPEA